VRMVRRKGYCSERARGARVESNLQVDLGDTFLYKKRKTPEVSEKGKKYYGGKVCAQRAY